MPTAQNKQMSLCILNIELSYFFYYYFKWLLYAVFREVSRTLSSSGRWFPLRCVTCDRWRTVSKSWWRHACQAPRPPTPTWVSSAAWKSPIGWNWLVQCLESLSLEAICSCLQMLYIGMCVYIYICLCLYIHTHTHMYNQPPKLMVCCPYLFLKSFKPMMWTCFMLQIFLNPGRSIEFAIHFQCVLCVYVWALKNVSIFYFHCSLFCLSHSIPHFFLILFSVLSFLFFSSFPFGQLTEWPRFFKPALCTLW